MASWVKAAAVIEQTAPSRDDDRAVLGSRSAAAHAGPPAGTSSTDAARSRRAARAVNDDHDLVDVTAEFYDADYYGSAYDQSGVPYSRNEALWVELFDRIGGSIVKTLQPASALDVGCAMGMLVEALRDRGVDAHGIDISSWAIGQVPPGLRPFCRVGSITDEIEGHYDLITCTEVLEHLPPSLVEASVGNLCRHADMVLFSSTPDDFDEPTHLNVEPVGYWAQQFLRHGFVHDVDYDATFLAPHAMLFRRGETDAAHLVADYERALWRTATLRAEHDELARPVRGGRRGAGGPLSGRGPPGRGAGQRGAPALRREPGRLRNGAPVRGRPAAPGRTGVDARCRTGGRLRDPPLPVRRQAAPPLRPAPRATRWRPARPHRPCRRR